MDDQRIIELIRTGKSDLALNALYKSFPMIRGLVRSKGGNTKDAEDIFQEALIILLRKAKDNDFKLTAQLSTYLFSVCRFLWKDQLKRQKPHLPFDGDTGLTGPEALGLSDVEEAGLSAALETETRIKLPLREIAVRMRYTSENSTKNQKYKCLEAARNRLKELNSATQTF